MTVIATVSVPAADFELGRAMGGGEPVHVDLEQLVPLSQAFLPYFWVDGDDADALETTLSEHSYVASVARIDTVNGQELFRVEWVEDVDGLITRLVEFEAAVLEGATAADRRWRFLLRFRGYDALSGFYRSCVKDGIALELERLHQGIEADPATSRFGLTPLQRETLVTALEAGYYAVPREVTLGELAERLEVSDSAISARLRRAETTLITATLLDSTAGRRVERDLMR